MKKFLLSTICALLTSAGLADAAIALSSNNSGGAGRVVTTSSSTALTGGSIRIGYFADIVQSDTIMRGGDYAALQAIFIPLGEKTSVPSGGDVTNPVVAGDLPVPIGNITAGKFNGTIDGIQNSYAPSGTRIFLLISNSADPKTSAPTEWALISNAGWTVPTDDVLAPPSLTMAVNTTNIGASQVWRGSLGSNTNLTLAAAAAVPEPSIAILCLVGVFAGLRRRK